MLSLLMVLEIMWIDGFFPELWFEAALDSSFLLFYSLVGQ